MLHVEHLFISPDHNFFGHHGQPAEEHPIVAMEQVDCVAGRRIRGDRFFDFKENYQGLPGSDFVLRDGSMGRLAPRIESAERPATSHPAQCSRARRGFDWVDRKTVRSSGQAPRGRGRKQTVSLDEPRARAGRGGLAEGPRGSALPHFGRRPTAPRS